MKKYNSILILFILLINGCYSNDLHSDKYHPDNSIEFVRNFLSERELHNKLSYIREGSNYLKTHDTSSILNEFPAEYLELKRSEEKMDANEEIIEVVLKKVLVGIKLIDMTQSIFLWKYEGKLKIDLDASLYRDQNLLDSLLNNDIEFQKEMRVYVTPFTVGENERINNRRPLMAMIDNSSGENLYVLEKSIYNQLREIFSKNKLAHLIVHVYYRTENEYSIIVDSLIQVGWIKNKTGS